MDNTYTIEDALDRINGTIENDLVVYYDDTTDLWYAGPASDLGDLVDLMNDQATSQDAYSHWCAGVSHGDGYKTEEEAKRAYKNHQNSVADPTIRDLDETIRRSIAGEEDIQCIMADSGAPYAADAGYLEDLARELGLSPREVQVMILAELGVSRELISGFMDGFNN